MSEDDAPWAALGLREEAAVFESASQNARVLTEGWVAASLVCPNCGAQPITRFAANRPVADVLCDAGSEAYELKSQKVRLGARVVDGAWATMTARLQAQNNPNLLVMRYDRARAQVCDLIVVPKPFFTPGVIERRKPTQPKGRANPWVGCNILLGEVPEAGEVAVIREGVAPPRTEVIARFRGTLFLRAAGAGARGWMIEVLKRVERIGADASSLDDVYAFEGRLAAIYPANANVGGRRAGGSCRCCGMRGWSCSKGGGGIGGRGGIRAPAARGARGTGRGSAAVLARLKGRFALRCARP